MRISFHNNDGSAVLPWQKITRIESGFHEVQFPRYSVLTFRVEFSNVLLSSEPSSVVKLSEKRHAIPYAGTLKLGSLEHYRQFEEAADGIGDEMEGRFHQDIVGFPSKLGETKLSFPGEVSGTVTWQAGNMWLYCTSIEPSSNAVLRRMKRTFGTDYATRIEKPSEFALELGGLVGANVQWAGLKMDGAQRLLHTLQTVAGYERIVHVYHGRVLYTDDGFSSVEPLDELEKSVAACFIKRTKYAWQQEYRFAISVGAEPDPDPFIVPMSPRVKNLAVGEDAEDS